MKGVNVSTREISRGFTKLLREVVREGAEVTVTSRGKPVAVLCPYDRYKRAMRRQALNELLALADKHLQGLTLAETYYPSRRELEERPADD